VIAVGTRAVARTAEKRDETDTDLERYRQYCPYLYPYATHVQYSTHSLYSPSYYGIISDASMDASIQRPTSANAMRGVEAGTVLGLY
jgi:hypothetical protein